MNDRIVLGKKSGRYQMFLVCESPLWASQLTFLRELFGFYLMQKIFCMSLFVEWSDFEVIQIHAAIAHHDMRCGAFAQRRPEIDPELALRQLSGRLGTIEAIINTDPL